MATMTRESGSGSRAPRRDFDARLLRVAQRLGAEVRFGVTAEGVIERDGRVLGVTTSRGPIARRSHSMRQAGPPARSEIGDHGSQLFAASRGTLWVRDWRFPRSGPRTRVSRRTRRMDLDGPRRPQALSLDEPLLE